VLGRSGGKQSTGLFSDPPHPFGGVHTSTGAPPSARFPGQWFQSESGLHQNWMRDYDPTTGRYLQADPLGLEDGASVYGYVKQNPGRWIDPTGELCRTVGRDKFGNQITECDSGRNCPPGADCNWRNPKENNVEYDQCMDSCELSSNEVTGGLGGIFCEGLTGVAGVCSGGLGAVAVGGTCFRLRISMLCAQKCGY
jgi:RHS repeat-associated protein